MRSINFNLTFLLLSLLFFLHCEKDDICITSIQESPDLVILLLNESEETRQTPPGFTIRPIGTEKQLIQRTGDSLPLPLKLSESNTQFEFITNAGSPDENIDTLQINYRRIDQFINGACGYHANFILDKAAPIFLLNAGNNWIKGAVILKDTISDETTAHLGILY